MVTGPLSSSSPPRGHKEIFLYFLSLLLGLISKWVGKPSLLEAGVQTLPLKAPITSQSLTHLKLKREGKNKSAEQQRKMAQSKCLLDKST